MAMSAARKRVLFYAAFEHEADAAALTGHRALSDVLFGMSAHFARRMGIGEECRELRMTDEERALFEKMADSLQAAIEAMCE